MKNLIASKMDAKCPNTKAKHKKLVQKMILLCSPSKECVDTNMKRIKKLCEIDNASIFEFKDKVKQYRRAYNLTLDQLIKQLAHALSQKQAQVKKRYNHSLLAKNLRRKLLDTSDKKLQNFTVDCHFDNIGTTISFIKETVDGDISITIQEDNTDGVITTTHENLEEVMAMIRAICEEKIEVNGTYGILNDIDYSYE